ncbi:hypothetical protein [Stenotrophomonas sp. YIM B06876]|uniref:hypothetical protein n=1 Tax=Stenotrophomonas sp. YIM B06876 TaxID=3060211 RepID=UPI002738B649|nr:hypothetical protein [Stenotrophomonas sp. YIM B06876]
MDVAVPLVVALSGLPALGLALWTGEANAPQARAIGLRWALVALCLFIGAIGLYFAGDSKRLVYAVVIAMALGVNALLVSMLLRLRKDGNGNPRQ